MLRRHSERPDYSEAAGHQITETRTTRKRLSFWVWLVPVVLGTVAMAGLGIKDYRGLHPSATETDRAVQAAQQFVKDKIGMGYVTRFAPRDWTAVDQEGDHYVVRGWVVATPTRGAAAQSLDYVCVVFRNPDGEWWPDKIDLMPQ